MSINNDLKRAAEAVLAMDYPWEHTVRDGRLGKTSTEYARLAHPLSVRALIVENERLTGCIVQRRAQAEQYDQALIKMAAERDQLRAAISTPELVFVNMKAGRIAKISLRSAIDLHGEVINGDDAQQIEIAKLRAEVAGLRTGYEAYEQVNAELKAEVEALRRVTGNRYAPPRAPLTGPSKCLACGEIHYGMGGLPCPNMRITAQADLPETLSGQIGAAMGQGEQS